MLKNILYIVAVGSLLLFSYSCNRADKNGFSVSLSFIHADKLNASYPSSNSQTLQVYLAEVPYGKDQAPVIMDSSKLLGNNGIVSLTANSKTEGIYELIFGNNIISIPLINDAAAIKVDVDLAKRDNFYQVSGSAASKDLLNLIDTLGQKNYRVEKAFADLDSLKRAGIPDSVAIAATQVKNNAIEDLNNYLKHFLNNSNNSTLAVLALSWGRSLSKSDFETALDGLQKKFPDNLTLQNIKKTYDAQQAEMEKEQASNNAWVGKQAPELDLPDANGKDIPLSSFRGKYVLVDFWASWCGPCRMENPNVVKAYQAFKNKNFTVLGVSLDKEKDAWQNAIRQDGLAWTHVSDLKYWNSKAVDVFKFDGIPFNVLIDPQGKIIAQELRGDALENKLGELLK